MGEQPLAPFSPGQGHVNYHNIRGYTCSAFFSLSLLSRLVLSPPSLSPFFHRDLQFSNHPPGQSLGASAMKLDRTGSRCLCSGRCLHYLRPHFLFVDQAILARHISLIRRWWRIQVSSPKKAMPELSEGQNHIVPSPSSMDDWIGPQSLAIEFDEYAFH